MHLPPASESPINANHGKCSEAPLSNVKKGTQCHTISKPSQRSLAPTGTSKSYDYNLQLDI